MSLVILVANEKVAYLCGDRRMTTVSFKNQFDPVYSDDMAKVFKLNNEIMLGIVGNYDICSEFFKTIMLNGNVNQYNSDLTYTKMIQFLDVRFERFIKEFKGYGISEEDLGFAGLVVGKERGGIRGVTYGYPLPDNKPQRHVFKGGMKLLTYGDRRHEATFINEYNQSKCTGKERIIESFSKTLNIGSQYDKRINTQFDVEEIEV